MTLCDSSFKKCYATDPLDVSCTLLPWKLCGARFARSVASSQLWESILCAMLLLSATHSFTWPLNFLPIKLFFFLLCLELVSFLIFTQFLTFNKRSSGDWFICSKGFDIYILWIIVITSSCLSLEVQALWAMKNHSYEQLTPSLGYVDFITISQLFLDLIFFFERLKIQELEKH